jgi:hypothetical protein
MTMDTTNCTPGTASDAAFKSNNYQCDTQLLIYWLFNIAMSIMGLASRWLRYVQPRSYQQTNKTTTTTMIPLNKFREINYILTTLLSTILFIGIGTNQTSYANGLSFSLINMIFLSCVIEMQLSWSGKIQRTILITGHHLNSNNQKNNNSSSPSSIIVVGNSDQTYRINLSQCGQFLTTLSIICVFISAIIMIFVSPLINISDRQTLTVFGWAFKSAYFCFFMLGVGNQLSTTTKTIRHFYVTEQAEHKRVLLHHALQKLRFESLFLSVFPLVGFIMYFIMSTRTVDWTWPLILSTVWFDPVGAIIYELVRRRRRRREGEMAGKNMKKKKVNTSSGVDEIQLPQQLPKNNNDNRIEDDDNNNNSAAIVINTREN